MVIFFFSHKESSETGSPGLYGGCMLASVSQDSTKFCYPCAMDSVVSLCILN